MQIYTLAFKRQLRMNLVVIRQTALVAFLLGAALSSEAMGQARSLMDIYGASEDDASSLSARRDPGVISSKSQLEYSSALQAPLEGAIDPTAYLVGPNDQFTVTIGGVQPIVSIIVVSADGVLVIPGIGRVQAGGRTLAEVQAETKAMLGTSFSHVEVDISLSRPREFWVHVTGAVPQPGRYLSRPVGRLDDVLRQAFLQAEANNANLDPTFRPALRNVSIRHQDGSSDSYDLVRYYRTGDVSSNPYLRDGDAIKIHSYDRSRSSIFVSGDVPFPGDYDFRPGDTILNILAISAGNVELQPDRVVRLTRRNPDGTLVTENFELAMMMNGTVTAPELQPLDQIVVPILEDGRGIAAAKGWLRYPGQYPIQVGVTTLADLVNMAGGFRDDALVRGAYLERNAAFGKTLGFADPILPSPGRFEVITDSSAALWQMRLGDFEYFSRQFLARWFKMNDRVSVDVSEATQPGAPPVYLQDGDRLYVPKDENAVYVIGEVVRPGRTPVALGRSAEDYISSVGGRGPRADNAYVIRAGSGQILDAKAPIYSGDYLFVDREGGESASLETERLRIMDQERATREKQVLLGAVTATAAVITTTILVIQQLK